MMTRTKRLTREVPHDVKEEEEEEELAWAPFSPFHGVSP